jgi:hypothetical protein
LCQIGCFWVQQKGSERERGEATNQQTDQIDQKESRQGERQIGDKGASRKGGDL